MDLLQTCVLLFTLMAAAAVATVADTKKPAKDPSLEIYKKLFETKRKDQLTALKNLVELNDINQQYKIIDIMLKGLFKVLEDSKAVLIAADVQPDGAFPQDEKIKNAYSHVTENTAFFGDVTLRFPKIVHHYFDRNSNWNQLIRWGIGFCNQTRIFEGGPHAQLLGLMAQELGISEKSPEYRNPFWTNEEENQVAPSSRDTFLSLRYVEVEGQGRDPRLPEIEARTVPGVGVYPVWLMWEPDWDVYRDDYGVTWEVARHFVEFRRFPYILLRALREEE
ncbi:coiled-coil domain-containing protein 134 isoform X2 [Latimeria chalumnae]|uniref:coiled-coil domain-containing protein 134 isoform X2 n=1 Tax=Latimeria chalumnae TaxID=7897 RepID=UPI00313DE7D9